MNPYIGYGKVIGGDRLVGRSQFLDEISGRLSGGGGSVALIGCPRIGKTSIASEVMRRPIEPGSRTIRVWIDLSTVPGSLELFRTIAEDFGAGINALDQNSRKTVDSILRLSVADSYEAYRCARQVLTISAAASFSFQLFIDEFDWIRKFADSQATIQRLRDLIYRKFETGLSAVFIARRSLRAIEMAISGISTLDGVCEQHYITALDNAGLHQLVDRSAHAGWHPTEAEFNLLTQFTGGHPYLAEMILCRAWATRSMQDGIDQSLSEIFDFYEHLRKLLEEDELFDQLLQIVIGPRISLRPGSLERLLRYGLIRRVKAAEAEHYDGWSSHFHQYLERCSRETPFFDLWREAEVAIRDTIVETYSDRLGQDWVLTLTQRHKSLGSVLGGCIERMNREKNNFGTEASVTLLDYSYPMDLWTLISAEWPYFNAIFGKTKEYWGQRFSHLAKVRTPTAHNRQFVVPQYEVRLAQAYCEEVLARIRSAQTGHIQ